MPSDDVSQTPVPALEALDDFLDALRNEFRSNPELAYRVLKALPVNIHFASEEAARFVSPIELIADLTEVAAEARLEAFSVTELKKMAQNANLATPSDLKGLKKPALISLIVKRGQEKIAERRL